MGYIVHFTGHKRMCYWVDMSGHPKTYTAKMAGCRVTGRKRCVTESICQKASKHNLRQWWVTGSISTGGKRMCYWVDMWGPINTRCHNDGLQGRFWNVANRINTHCDDDGLQGRFRPVAKECVTRIDMAGYLQIHTATMTGYRVDFDRW